MLHNQNQKRANYYLNFIKGILKRKTAIYIKDNSLSLI